MKNPVVSVIMGVYNPLSKEKIEMAINSILNQTVINLEFIICNDGSRLSVKGWLEKIARKDSRIKILHHCQNKGLHNALNYCIQESRAMFIARMDDDDISEPTRLEKQLSFLSNNPEYDIVGANAWYIDNQNAVWKERTMPQIVKKTDFLFNSPFIHPAVMIRKEALIKLTGYGRNTFCRRVEDYDLFMRAYALGMKGYNIQESLLYYREDLTSYKKRKYRYRINEMIVRCRGFWKLGLFPIGVPYVIKPLLVGLIPNSLLIKWRKGK